MTEKQQAVINAAVRLIAHRRDEHSVREEITRRVGATADFAERARLEYRASVANALSWEEFNILMATVDALREDPE